MLKLHLARIFLAVCLSTVASSCVFAEEKLIVGYVMPGSEIGRLQDGDVFGKLTHLNLAFANPADDAGNFKIAPNFERYTEAARKANIKVLISIGGGSASESAQLRERYFGLINDANRSAFVAKLVALVKDHHWDGLDVDLEGPAINSDYGKFIQDLSKRFREEKLLLTAALSKGYGGSSVPNSALQAFDFINVMAYDATGPWAPQNPGQHSSFEFAKSNVAYWLERGLPKDKLILGVPFYGHGFNEGKGHHTYRSILKDHPEAKEQDSINNVIFYNGMKTIAAKSQYVKDNGLGGIMIWEISQDTTDENSLLNIIYQTLR